MAWRIKVTHTTAFQYESEVSASFNEARMTPLSNQSQFLVQHDLKVKPASSVFTYQDYFGTTVKSFDVQSPHMALKIVSESVVDTSEFQPPAISISWEELKKERITEDFAEYLDFSSLVNPLTKDFDLSQQESPIAAVFHLNNIMRDYITYTPGATNVYSPASEAWEKKAGVCQDFSHATLSILREVGIPARYISGYLYTGLGEIGEEVIGESHSWVEAWVGYWMPIDPTNGRPVVEDHIVVAKGRDYHDVSPLKGIFSGGRSRKIEVTVSLIRLDR